jgi:hypothetical protein
LAELLSRFFCSTIPAEDGVSMGERLLWRDPKCLGPPAPIRVCGLRALRRFPLATSLQRVAPLPVSLAAWGMCQARASRQVQPPDLHHLLDRCEYSFQSPRLDQRSYRPSVPPDPILKGDRPIFRTYVHDAQVAAPFPAELATPSPGLGRVSPVERVDLTRTALEPRR